MTSPWGMRMPKSVSACEKNAGSFARRFAGEICWVLLDGFPPDELVLVGDGFDLRAVDEDVVQGDGSELFEEVPHLREDVPDAGAQALREETGDGRMVRCRLSFQQIHELDIAAAGFLDSARGEDAVRVGVDKDGEHLRWRRLISIDVMAILIQGRQIHSSNAIAHQADGIILGNL